MDEILRAPQNVVVQADVPASLAAARLATMLAEQPRIEPASRLSSDRHQIGQSDRHLVGRVDGVGVHLSVWDANVLSRRKSWNIEFDGAFESATSDAILKGTIDIPDRIQLRVILWMFRIGTAFAAILAVGLDVRGFSLGQPVVLWPAIAAIVIVPFVAFVLRRMERDGLRRAADDARLMTAAVGRLLHEGH